MNIYAPNIGATKCIQQVLTDINRKTDCKTRVEDFNIPLTLMDRLSRQNVNKKTLVLNDNIRRDGLNRCIQNIHPKTAEFTFSPVHTGHSPGQITCQATKQPSINLKKINFQPQGYETRNQLQEENWETLKNVKIKQYVAEQPMGQ